MSEYPKVIQQLVAFFRRFPGVGAKSADRFIFHLLKLSAPERETFAESIRNLHNAIKTCAICGRFDDQSPCTICANLKRDHATICVVAEPQDIQPIEKTGEFSGVYHVLGGVLNALDGITKDQLSIDKLLERIKTAKPTIREVIIATNADLEGETTALYLARVLKNSKVIVTRLAKGLPIGSNIEYADEITLSSALKDRKRLL